MVLARRYAFGTGTQVLPIPELMPFRLTRQLAGVLAPHDALSVLAGPMAAAFAALRAGADVLEVRLLLFALHAATLMCFSGMVVFQHLTRHCTVCCETRVSWW